MLFRIDACVDVAPEHETQVSLRLTGCVALDFCRKWGLPDVTDLVLDNTRTEWYELPEKYARMYFRPDAVGMTAIIPITALVPGELRMKGRIACLAELPLERLLELLPVAELE